MEENNKSIGLLIKNWRKKVGLTQDALAKKADIPYTTLAKLESDVIKNPSIQTMRKIAEGLEVSLDDLIKENNVQWWMEEYGFFGNFYLEGDNSKEGYLQAKKQNLDDRTKEEVSGVMKILGLKGKERILDIPCGYGRHSAALAGKGFQVTGCDINSFFLEAARKQAEISGVKVKFVKDNMIDISYTSQFDAVINMFYSFGFFETDEENFKVLKNFYNALKQKGKLLFHTDVNIPRILNKKCKEDEIRNLKSGKKLRIIDKYDPHTKRINGSWIIQGGEEVKKDYSVRVYTQEEFIDLCRKVGFKKFESFGGWSKEPYSNESEDMIIVAEK